MTKERACANRKVVSIRLENDEAKLHELQRKSALAYDLLRIIDHCHQSDEGRVGLSAVIDTAMLHIQDINEVLDDLSGAIIHSHSDRSL